MANASSALLAKPSKSLYRGALGKKQHQWSYKDELTRERLLVLLCIVLLPISLGLYGASIPKQDLVISQGDGQNVAAGQLGYSQICFTGVDSSGALLAQDCASIGTSCTFSFSPSVQAFQQANYGFYDSQLEGCTEFNAYRGFHVMGIIFAGFAFLFMLAAHIRIVPASLLVRVKILALETSFASGACGAIAHCLFIDWWNTNQQFLITLAYLSEAQGNGSTPGYVILQQSFFDLVGGWVAAICSCLLFVFHFRSPASK